MLTSNLYTIQSFVHSPNTVVASLLLNAGHPIFKGHYPSQPVLPGACMLQAVKEVLQQALNAEIILVKADNLKFLAMIDPVSDPILTLNLSYITAGNSEMKVTASLKTYRTVGLKFQGRFKVV